MPPAADPVRGPRLALVVATGTYADPGLRRLRSPARDAADLAQVLADPAIGGFTVTTVIDQPAQRIRLAIEDFLADRNTGDLLLVYLSCHGLLNARRQLYFAATDTRKDRLGATGIESNWVLEQMEHCRARSQVLILDSCFSGAFAHRPKGEGDLDLRDSFLGQGRGRVILTASTATEYSFEGEPKDATISPAGSVFTAALVQGLRTGAADTDRDGHISVDDAYAYVFDQVQAAGAAQTPQRWLYGAQGQILLARNPAGPAVTLAPLPESLRVSLGSPYPSVRIGAVTELGTWLSSEDPARAATARRHLQELADGTDIPHVARAARALLGTETTTEPPVPAVPHGAAPAPRPPSAPVSALPSRLVRILVGHAAFVLDMAFSPDGRQLATASFDGTVRLWDPATGDCLRTLTCYAKWAGNQGRVRGVAFSPDGRLLAVAADTTGQLWDPATGDRLRTIAGFTGPVLDVAFSPDGRLLATGSVGDPTVQLWDPATGDRLRTLTGHTFPVQTVAFSRDGGLLATGGGDGTVRLWDPTTGDCLRTLTRQVNRLRALVSLPVVWRAAFSPDGRLLATAGNDRTVRLWDPATGDCLRTLTGNAKRGVKGVAFSPDGRLLVTVDDDMTALLWNPATGDYLHTLNDFTAHSGSNIIGLHGVAFSPDGRLLATASGAGSVQLWN